MKKLVMLLFVLALCVPSFGASAVLVYKVTLADKPVIVDANFNTGLVNYYTAASVKGSASFKGYLVLDVNTTTLETAYDANESGADDANFTPTLILKGKHPITKVKTTWVLKDTDQDVSINRLITTEKKPKKYASLNWDNFEGVPDANVYSWENSFGKLVGTALVKGGTKVEVPKSLKGNGNLEHWISESKIPFTCPGDGTVKLTLDVTKTKKANLAGSTVKAVAAGLE